MALRFYSFSSSSSGNCYLVKSENTALLVDAGISGKKIIESLCETETPLEDIKGVLITHEHVDHVKSVRVLSKKLCQADIYANLETWSKMPADISEEKIKIFKTEDSFEIGDIKIKPFRISHDASEPVGFTFICEEKQLSIVTDTGYITEEIYKEVKGADLLVLESNHDESMLKMGKYPWNVKQRILGPQGHLSNESAGECISSIMTERKASEEECRPLQVLLAHLSSENNFPQLAYHTVKNVLEASEHYLGEMLSIEILMKNQVSKLYEI